MMWCNDSEINEKRCEFVKQRNIIQMAVWARGSCMQEKFRMCKDDSKGFHRVLNSVTGKQKSLVLPSFNVNHSAEDFIQLFVDMGLNLQNQSQILHGKTSKKASYSLCF